MNKIILSNLKRFFSIGEINYPLKVEGDLNITEKPTEDELAELGKAYWEKLPPDEQEEFFRKNEIVPRRNAEGKPLPLFQ